MIQSDQKSQHLSFDSENRLQTSGEYQNTWNDNGWLVSRTHMVTQTETHFEYSARGKLTSVRYSDGSSSTFSYYPESDLRLEATHPQNPPTRYLFDGESEFVTLSSTNQALTTISSLPNSYDDRLFQRTSDGDLTTWLTDHLNSVRKTVTDTSDINSAQTFAYYAFGSLRSGDPINNLAFGYTGRSLDLPANLYYYRGRMMDTCSGTFTQVDPMQDGNNWTAYVGGDPISYNDPSGYITFQVGFDFNFTKPGFAGGLNAGAFLTTNNHYNPLKWSFGGYTSFRGGSGIGNGGGVNLTFTGSGNKSVDALRGASISSGYSAAVKRVGISQEWHRPVDSSLNTFHEVGIDLRRLFVKIDPKRPPYEGSMHAANMSYTYASGRTFEHWFAGLMDKLDKVPGQVASVFRGNCEKR